MILRYCAWCTPRRFLGQIDDGRPEVIETDTICPACTERLMGQEAARVAYRELSGMTLDGRATLVTPRVRAILDSDFQERIAEAAAEAGEEEFPFEAHQLSLGLAEDLGERLR